MKTLAANVQDSGGDYLTLLAAKLESPFPGEVSLVRNPSGFISWFRNVKNTFLQD